MNMRFFATAPPGFGDLLASELAGLGATKVIVKPAGTAFRGGLEVAYRACLWSRVANRILMPLAQVPARDTDELYTGTREILWREHLDVHGSFAVDCQLRRAHIQDGRYAALKVKDAIADQFRDALGIRPDVDREQPALRVNVYLERDRATLSVDLTGDSLHRRGFRAAGGPAPLKENLAAGLLLRTGWPAIAQAGGPLVEPMCGAGTLAIEAALMAGDIAPGLTRDRFGFLGWPGHDPALWARLLDEARTRREAGLANLPAIRASDPDPGAVSRSSRHIATAGLAGAIRVHRLAMADCRPPSGSGTVRGLVIFNPPYGQRMGDKRTLGHLYRDAGRVLRERFQGWHAAMLSGDPALSRQIGIRPRHTNTVRNGRIACRLLRYEIEPRWFTSSDTVPPA